MNLYKVNARHAGVFDGFAIKICNKNLRLNIRAAIPVFIFSIFLNMILSIG